MDKPNYPMADALFGIFGYRRAEGMDENARVRIFSMPKIKTHSFLGKKFKIAFGRTPGRLGGTSSREESKPDMFIDDRLCGWQLVEVATHEAIHACFDDRIPEKDVEQAGLEISKFVRRIMEQHNAIIEAQMEAQP